MLDAVVLGGGFFGCSLALMLAERGARVEVVEREPGLLARASYVNQARVHNGYHYPRSILTGLRSRVNCPRFLEDFAGCIDRSFRHWYAIARRQSNVTARQFEAFCRRIDAPLRPAPLQARALFSPLVEAVWEVEEYAFDADALRAELQKRLERARIAVRTGWAAETVRGIPAGAVLRGRDAAGEHELTARRVFNCTYSSANVILGASGLEPVALRHELTELALIEQPPELAHAAVTVMCGPFFSTVPFPPARLHSLSHVRYTPHGAWEERAGDAPRERPQPQASRAVHMLKDAARYVPVLAEARYRRSLFEVKTVLPQSEANDARPILFRPTPRLPALVTVVGGKIDNVYDLPRELELLAAA